MQEPFISVLMGLRFPMKLFTVQLHFYFKTTIFLLIFSLRTFREPADFLKSSLVTCGLSKLENIPFRPIIYVFRNETIYKKTKNYLMLNTVRNI